MIIVTGAAGFIGSALVWELNQQGVKDIICVDNYRSGPKWKNLAKRTFSDFLFQDELPEFLHNQDVVKNIEAIFHMGACSATTQTDMDYLLDNNHRYSQILFSWCADNNVPFIYASSAATYGAGEFGYDDEFESQKLIPLNPYGYSKVLFDRWALKQTKTPPKWTGLKFFNVYGPQEYHKGEMASLVYKSVGEIKKTGSLGLFKSHRADYQNGKQMRDFVYVKDITRWMWHIYSNDFKSGIYNFGFGKSRTWLDLATQVFEALKSPIKIQWVDIPENIRSQYQYFTEAKMTKAYQAGLPLAQWSLEAGINDYLTNYLLKDDKYL